MNALLAACLAWSGSPATAAIGYQAFAHPKGDYRVEYPADWKRSVGMETLKLSPPGAAGKLLRISVERWPLGVKDPATPAAFVDDLLAKAAGLRKLDARETIKVAGKDAERLTFTDTGVLRGRQGTTLPGPLTEVVVVVPVTKGFYALRLSGMGKDLAAARPEFDRLVSKISFDVGRGAPKTAR